MTIFIRFLKLMLGVAVTCTNKQTFITKIQSLDETAQVSVVSTKERLTGCGYIDPRLVNWIVYT